MFAVRRLSYVLLVTIAFAGNFSAIVQAEDDIVLGEFDDESLSGWTVKGNAFSVINDADLLHRMDVRNFIGGVASSELNGDEPQGVLISKPFTINRDFITFRIAGGNHETHTCVNLVIDHRVVLSTTGENSDTLFPAAWDVHDMKGKLAQLEIVDASGGDWGHIIADHIVLTDNPEITPRRVAPIYTEALRPQFHITARQFTTNRLNPGMRQEGWINDLNGMIYYQGEWHLFAQRWAETWLHFVSSDLIHWTELEPGFYEAWNGEGMQSGSIVIDYSNSSGLSDSVDKPALVAFYPQWNNKDQCIIYSLDRGRTWSRYRSNPVLQMPERDPKVFWYEPAKHWCMLLYGEGKYHFLISRNLLDWKPTGCVIEGYECPDFCELPLDGKAEQPRWVLIHGDGGYQIGTFDGRTFAPENAKRLFIDAGEYYATQTFNNTENGANSRRIQMAWMRFSNFPDMPFSQMISFPGELSLRTTDQGPRLFREPIAEVTQLHQGPAIKFVDSDLSRGIQLAARGELFHVVADVDIAAGSQLILNLRGQRLTLESNRFQLDHHSADVDHPITHIELLLDRTSIELYVNHGEKTCTHFFLASNNTLDIVDKNPKVRVDALTLWNLKSAWRSLQKP